MDADSHGGSEPTHPGPGALHHGELTLRGGVEMVPTLRAAVGDIAMRAEWDVDRVDDLRILTDELATLLLVVAPGRTWTVDVGVQPELISLHASIPAGADTRVLRTGFAWRLVGALADEVEMTDASDERLDIRVVVRRSARGRPD